MKNAILILYVLVVVAVMLATSILEIYAGNAPWQHGLLLAGWFVFGWYHRRIYGAWRRLFGLP